MLSVFGVADLLDLGLFVVLVVPNLLTMLCRWCLLRLLYFVDCYCIWWVCCVLVLCLCSRLAVLGI